MIANQYLGRLDGVSVEVLTQNKSFAAVADLRRQHVFLTFTFKSGFCWQQIGALLSLEKHNNLYTLGQKKSLAQY